jgi:ribonuclease HIII
MPAPISCLLLIPNEAKPTPAILSEIAGRILPKLISLDLDPRPPSNPHILLEASSNSAVFTLYKSGKVVISGKRTEDLYQYLLHNRIVSHSSSHQTRQTTASDHDLLANTPHMGADESGKGDYFGPLCTAAIAATVEEMQMIAQWGVQDSKALSDDQIVPLARKIASHLPYSIHVLQPQEYNLLYRQFNNLNALLASQHAKTIKGLVKNAPQFTVVLVDQFSSGPWMSQSLRSLEETRNLTLHQRTKGESDTAVAAASILARAAFISQLERLSQEFGLSLPKGCGSNVRNYGLKIYRQGGLDLLSKLAKLHFKTTQEIQLQIESDI